uniref:V-type proton ATPase subunit S1 n=1 Tax=Chelydra serpentina TaxID=8475 RepID=A0A8C3T826_CHESE
MSIWMLKSIPVKNIFNFNFSSLWNSEATLHEGHIISKQELHMLLQPVFTQDSKNLVLFLQDMLSIDDFTHYSESYGNEKPFHNLQELLESSSSSLVLSAVDCQATSHLLDYLQESMDWTLTDIDDFEVSKLEVDTSKPNIFVVKLQPLSRYGACCNKDWNGHFCIQDFQAFLKMPYVLTIFLMTKKFYAGSARTWFTLDSVEIAHDNQMVARFNVSLISAPAEYSFHCQLVGTSNLYGAKLIPANSEAKNWDIYLSEFQIQGFNINNNWFSYASDCTSFFSPGIWMGLVTSAVLLWILTYGIHMIMQLTTNSRFDDPKGQALSVPQTE